MASRIPLTPHKGCDNFHSVFGATVFEDALRQEQHPGAANPRPGGDKFCQDWQAANEGRIQGERFSMDPKALTSTDWHNIHLFLQWFWIYFPLITTFAITVLTAYALIPSAVATGHLPAGASKLKLPLTVFALLILAGAIIILILGISQTLDVRNFWSRLLI